MFTLQEVVQAYYDCRKNKKNKLSAIEFHNELEKNLTELTQELNDRSYEIGTSVCFVVTYPKAREVWAANFRDRVVHHVIYNRLKEYYQRRFIADSCACIPTRGNLYATDRLDHKIRSITQNWKKKSYYLKCDLSNFFGSINKDILFNIFEKNNHQEEDIWLLHKIIYHDCTTNHYLKTPDRMPLVPSHKSLFNIDKRIGLPIGNLSSQFFANILLNELDQYAKHVLKCKYYMRYVDDFIILDNDKSKLFDSLQLLTLFCKEKLDLTINPKKTILQPIENGIDFVGYNHKPFRRLLRRRVIDNATRKLIQNFDVDKFLLSANSYLGFARQGSNFFFHKVISQIANTKGCEMNDIFTSLHKKKARPDEVLLYPH